MKGISMLRMFSNEVSSLLTFKFSGNKVFFHTLLGMGYDLPLESIAYRFRYKYHEIATFIPTQNHSPFLTI
jgi:hypothetical protein